MQKYLLFLILFCCSIFSFGQAVVQVGSSVSNMATGFTAPLYRTGNPSTGQQLYSRHFFVYDQSELCKAQLPVGGTITKLAWFKNGVGSKDGVVHSFKIYMKNSDVTSRNGDTWTNLTSGASKVYESDVLAVPNAEGWWELSLDVPFTYTGSCIEIYTDWFVGGGPNGDRTNGLISFGQTTMSGGFDNIRRAGGSAKFGPFTDDEFVGGGLFTNNVSSNLQTIRFAVSGGTAKTEICYNGIDDDCDGIIDEGCPAQYRTKNIGNWTTLNVWEKITNANVGWVQALTIPAVTDLPIAVRHNAITLNTIVVADQLTIDATGVLRMQFPGSLTLPNGTGDDFTNKGTFDMQNGSVLLTSGGNMVNEGITKVDASTFVAPVLNKATGTITFTGNSFSASMTNDGIINWNSGNLTADPSNQFINNAAGIFNIASDNNYGQGQINNKGSMRKTSTGTTTFTGNVVSTGTIRGVGTYNFQAGLNNSGVLAPGNSVGQLTVVSNGSFLSANSTLLFEVETGAGPGLGNDLLITNGNLVLSGKLMVTELPGAPAGDYELIRLTSGTLSGSFAQTIMPEGYTVKIVGNTLVVNKPSGVVTYPGSGNEIQYDGVSAVSGVNNNAAFNFAINQNFTVECWVRIPTGNQPDAAFPNNVIIEKWGSPWGSLPFAIWYYNQGAGTNAGKVAFVRHNGAGFYGTFSNVIINDDKYHHIVAQKEGTALRLYVDGILAGTATDQTTGTTTNTAPLIMGGSQDLSSSLKGSVDEVRVWNNALTLEQIRTWMCKKMTPSHPAFANLVVNYNCDQSPSSTVLTDVKGGFNANMLNSALIARSGAPIGDISAFGYGATPSAALNFPAPNAEKLTATSAPATLTGIHVYAVDAVPNSTNGITGVGGNNRYFGVFPIGSATPLYNAVYEYGANPNLGPGNIPALFKRNANNVQGWDAVTATHDAVLKTFTFTGTSTEYMLGSTGTALPLTLLTFTGKQQNNYNLLNWSTMQEQNTRQFVVERSVNATGFEAIGTVAARNQTGTHAYSFTDTKLAAAQGYYYRLKMMDIDGTSTYSPVVFIGENSSPLMSVYPNPVTNQVLVSGLKAGSIIRLINADGKLLQMQKITSTTITMQMGSYAKGMYMLQYELDGKIISQKVMKQ